MTKDELISLCLSFGGSYLDYPFDDEWAAIRHSDTKKTFAFIYIKEGKLLVNLKCEPMEADFLRQVYPFVLPAYHMNKVHWNTVYVNETDDEGLITQMIEMSYRLTSKKR